MASQAVSNSQVGSQLANNNRQAVSTNTVSTSQAGRQVIGGSNSQAISTNSQGDSTGPHQAASSQADSADFQAVSTISLGPALFPPGM